MEEKIRRCKYCGSDYRLRTGLNNWKNLLKKPTLDDFITLFIILMVIISAYAYKADIERINNYYNKEYSCDLVKTIYNSTDDDIKITNIIITNFTSEKPDSTSKQINSTSIANNSTSKPINN